MIAARCDVTFVSVTIQIYDRVFHFNGGFDVAARAIAQNELHRHECRGRRRHRRAAIDSLSSFFQQRQPSVRINSKLIAALAPAC